MSPKPKRSLARKRAAKKVVKKRTPTKAAKRAAEKAAKERAPTKAAKRGPLTNVELLREAGILTATQQLAPQYEKKLNQLSRGDVNALIRAMPDASYPGEVVPGIGREFIIV